MKSAEMPEPIRGDPVRVAAGLFKGIEYQVWHTVLAWFRLGEEEALVVEGAEDFDLLGSGEVVVNQVKNVVDPITLRSPCVCDSLRNFWAALHRNPGRAISFRLITTSGAAVESGAPFGKGRAGLDIWNEEADSKNSKYAESLRQFMISDKGLVDRLGAPFPDKIPSLVEHLRRLQPDKFHSEFLTRIRWLVAHSDLDAIRESVRCGLRAYGEVMNLPPRDSERAMSALFGCVIKAAQGRDRLLTKDMFRIEFDKETRVTIPITKLNQLMRDAEILRETESCKASGAPISSLISK